MSGTATCVDEVRGIFLIRNSSHGGVSHPIHVRKVMGGENVGVECEVTECMDNMKVAWRSGLTTAECHHLKEVGKNPTFPEKVILLPDTLEDLSKSGNFKIFSEDRIESCNALVAAAEMARSECIVPFIDGTRFIHFSVFHGDVNYYSS